MIKTWLIISRPNQISYYKNFWVPILFETNLTSYAINHIFGVSFNFCHKRIWNEMQFHCDIQAGQSQS